jgi:hypothetical protein
VNYAILEVEKLLPDERELILRNFIAALHIRGNDDLLWQGDLIRWICIEDAINRLEKQRTIEARRAELKDQIAALEVELAELEG